MRPPEKLIEFWKQQIHWATSKYNAEVQPVIEQNLRYYRGKHWPKMEATERTGWDLFTINKVFSNIKTIIPAINLRNPKALVQPKKKPYFDPATGTQVDTVRGAQLCEVVLNYFIRELNLRSEVTRVLTDSLLMPWGVMKLGYMPIIEKYTAGGDLLEVHELMHPSWPFWVRWSPQHFRMDPEADRIETARWVAFYRLMALEDIKANPNMKTPRDLVADVNLRKEWKVEGKEEPRWVTGGEDFQRVGVWEIWDRKTNKLIEMATGSSKFLRYDEWPYKIDGFPCELLYFNINPDEQVPIADVSAYKDQQDELNSIESLMIEHIKRHLPVILVTDGAIDEPVEMMKLQRGLIGRIVKVKGGAGGPKLSVDVLQGAQLSPDIHAVRAMINRDLDEISSVTELERGAALRVDTATEASILQSASSIKRLDKQASLEAFTSHVIRKFLQILQQTMSPLDLYAGESVLTKILDPQAVQEAQGWLTVRPEDVAGEYLIDIEVGSSVPINEALREKKAVEKFMLLRGDIGVDQRELKKRYLDAVGEPDIDGLIYNQEKIAQLGQMMQQQGGVPSDQGSPQQGSPQPKPAGLPERMGVGGTGLANALARIGGP